MIKKVSFEGWDNCVEMVSGDFRIIITTDVGPRVIGGFLGDSKNIFNVDPALAGKTGGKEWVNYGGHRLWHSPETRERTYEPDNSMIQVIELEDGGLSFISNPEEKSGIAKTINIYPVGEHSFRVEHYMRNVGVWPIELAAWGISVMAPGGVAVVPHNTAQKGLTPSKFISVWPYTKMNDPRIDWGEKLVMVRQDASDDAKPMKIGLNCEEGWIAYLNQGVAFIKQFDHFVDESYPDNGCSVEVYTCKEMLESETLSPLYTLDPGDEIIHIEEWTLLPTGDAEFKNEQDVIDFLQIDFDDEHDCCCGDDDCCCGDDDDNCSCGCHDK